MKTLQRLGWVGTSLACAAALMAACGSTSSGSSASRSSGSARTNSAYTIEEFTDLTGSASTTGQSGRAGSQYFWNRVNASGGVGGHSVKVNVCDTVSTPTGGSACADKVISSAIHIVTSDTSLGGAQAAATVLEGHAIFMSPVSPLSPKAGTTTFLVNESEAATLGPFLTAMQKQHLTKLGMIGTDNATGQVDAAILKQLAPKYGLKVTTVLASETATDDTPQLLQLKDSGAQSIFVAAIGSPVTTIIKSAQTLGMTTPLVLAGGATTNELLSTLGSPLPKHLYGTANIVVTNGNSTLDKDWANYRTGFQKESHAPLDEVGALAWFQGCVVEALLAKFGTKASATQMASYMRSHTFPCLGSTIRFTNPKLNIADGLPNSLVQAGSTAADGWGPVRNPL